MPVTIGDTSPTVAPAITSSSNRTPSSASRRWMRISPMLSRHSVDVSASPNRSAIAAASTN